MTILSPITSWLNGGGRRMVHATNDENGRIVVTLVEPDGIAGLGEGDTVDEAQAAALNDCMVRQHEAEEHRG